MAKGKKGKDKGKDKKGKKGKDKKGKGKKGKDSPRASAVPKKEEKKSIAVEDKKSDPCRCMPESCGEDLGCRPNSYPGLLDCPEPMAIVGSESGTYEGLCKLLHGGLKCTDRVLMMTPWGNYVVFRVKSTKQDRTVYFVFDGCTCNVNRFRYYDLNIGTAGLLFFKTTHEVLHYIMNSKLKREHFNRMRKTVIDDICKEYSGEFCKGNIKKIC